MTDLLRALPSFESHLRRAVFLSVLTPVYNECHLVAESLRRVLALQDDGIDRLEVVVVDDSSTDGSWEIVRAIASGDPRVKAIRHPQNLGKGAAVRTALEHAEGEVCLVHDADLEYNPEDIPKLLRPFIQEGADVVFGSRYMTAPYRRVLMYRHSLINRLLTLLANVVTDLDLSDVETCYKLINTALLRSFPLRSNDFRFEIEVTMKLARRRARIFEVPIRYLPRGYEDGKKIRPRDGFLAMCTLLRFTLMDDLVRDDDPRVAVHELQNAPRYRQWLADTLRPWLGDSIVEVDAGTGGLTSHFVPRRLYVASDHDPEHVRFLRTYSLGKPYLRALELTPDDPGDFAVLTGCFDTVLLVNVLERSERPRQVLANAHRALVPGGRVIVVAPAGPGRLNCLDKAARTLRRYSAESLQAEMGAAGFAVEAMSEFNRTAVPAWTVNGSWLRCTRVSRLQIKALEVMMPLIRRVDHLLPWSGLSLVAVGRSAGA